MKPSLRLATQTGQASSLRISNSRIREAVLNGVTSEGPPSLRSRWARARYQLLEGIDEAFMEAQKIISKEAERHRLEAAKLKQEIEKAESGDELNAKRKLYDFHRVRSDMYNPEVRFNELVGHLDLEQPVYRYFAEKKWSRKEKLILMQRLEQHHVIPDTLPTLEPRAKVDAQFVTPTSKWLEPGTIVANNVAERAPQIHVTEFCEVPPGSLYTILIVNPDVPDLERDSFSTSLCMAAVNVPLSNKDVRVDYTKGTVVAPYLPPHPEKNAGPQRFCLWVFRQEGPVAPELQSRENFDIRKFAADQHLDAIGAHMWRVEWDFSTDAIREKYGLGSGNVYYRARTAHPESALLHIRHRKKWIDKVAVPN